MRFINSERVIAAQLTTPEQNPLLSEDSLLMDVWFDGAAVRKQLFKKVTRAEKEQFFAGITARGFIRSGNLYIDPKAVLFAEMENQILGGIITIGWQENGKPVELKVNDESFRQICESLSGRNPAG